MKHLCEGEEAHISCHVDYASMVEGGSFHAGSGWSAPESLILTEHLLCSKGFNTSGQSSESTEIH